ncbi:sulfur carrier protein ThiS [Phaeobacter sp. B1627]|uniref:sulfur carrier protein ThiS n=1 Tax=Phaeobacter sp. B1627 TaxID=2583809 RepID=UPI00111AFA7D|nr:sulfur carrier protein ThiS [Phaeobacter sp. B1627]TNJ40565.1 sulfur carrier protein ThiS [Phaeobacter sp. B1627]
MEILVNSEPREVAGPTLSAALQELGYSGGAFATALNGHFVPRDRRGEQTLSAGDRIEVLAPMQGG